MLPKVQNTPHLMHHAAAQVTEGGSLESSDHGPATASKLVSTKITKAGASFEEKKLTRAFAIRWAGTSLRVSFLGVIDIAAGPRYPVNRQVMGSSERPVSGDTARSPANGVWGR